jgi:GntR family transcriptional regulator
MANSDPVYLRVVEDLRRQITDGSLPPGAPIPSRHQITRKYGVGETAARHALRVLAQEGLIVGRVGSGHRVRDRPTLLPLYRSRIQDHHSPFAADMQAQGRRATWEWQCDSAEAPPDIAIRLRLARSAPVTRTRYVFRGDGKPVQLATAYEPAELGDGPAALSDSHKVTEVIETVYSRVPQPAESDVLDLPAGVHVLHIERTHWVGERPIETSDIVIPCDQFRLVYTISG